MKLDVLFLLPLFTSTFTLQRATEELTGLSFDVHQFLFAVILHKIRKQFFFTYFIHSQLDYH